MFRFEIIYKEYKNMNTLYHIGKKLDLQSIRILFGQ